MVKVITYGTYDLIHYGHIRLLERAKALGDYLIVGVTADDFDKTRGKINVQQTLMERIEGVRATGLADEIVIEEYDGQKIDDIRRYDVDIFTVGSDWVGKFDYLKEYCDVIYLERTEGISSSEIRAKKANLKIGIEGEYAYFGKFINESRFVNGLEVTAIHSEYPVQELEDKAELLKPDYEALIDSVEAVYITSLPAKHYEQIKAALQRGKHVLCESPVALSEEQCAELFELAQNNNCILMEALKTAYSTAYSRMVLLAKSGKIGKILSVDATCTSLQNIPALSDDRKKYIWNSICAWGPTALLPVFQLLGTEYISAEMVSHPFPGQELFDAFTKVSFIYPEAVASVKVGKGAKSEGELVITGSEGYIYVPAPWWKTDYFEVRYEDPTLNKRYFYQLDGEGIRLEMVAFARAIINRKNNTYIGKDVTGAVSRMMEKYYSHDYVSI